MWFICNMFSWCTFGKQNYGLLHILYTLFPKWLEFFSLWNLNTFTFIQKWLALHSRYTFCQPLFVCKSNPWHWHHYCRAVLFKLQGMFKDFFLYGQLSSPDLSRESHIPFLSSPTCLGLPGSWAPWREILWIVFLSCVCSHSSPAWTPHESVNIQ